MATNLGIRIISTKEDFRLFTDYTYYSKVKKIVEDLKKEYDITDKHSIACHKDHIELYLDKNLMLVREIA